MKRSRRRRHDHRWRPRSRHSLHIVRPVDWVFPVSAMVIIVVLFLTIKI